MIELFRALATFTEPPGPETARLTEVLELPAAPSEEEYTELFVFQLYPYASVYLGAEGMLGGEARDRIAGFWRAIGEAAPNEPDHLAVMLALYARLGELEQSETQSLRRSALNRARVALLWEHLLSWLPAYLTKLIEIAPPSYVAWGRILHEALLSQARQLLGAERLPLHLREAPPLLGRGPESPGRIAEVVLAPVRCGMILTRADLARGARALGLALRMGERRFALDALLGQDRERVVCWLADEANRWVERHEALQDTLGEIAQFWAARARRSAGWLTALKNSTGARYA